MLSQRRQSATIAPIPFATMRSTHLLVLALCMLALLASATAGRQRLVVSETSIALTHYGDPLRGDMVRLHWVGSRPPAQWGEFLRGWRVFPMGVTVADSLLPLLCSNLILLQLNGRSFTVCVFVVSEPPFGGSPGR